MIFLYGHQCVKIMASGSVFYVFSSFCIEAGTSKIKAVWISERFLIRLGMSLAMREPNSRCKVDAKLNLVNFFLKCFFQQLDLISFSFTRPNVTTKFCNLIECTFSKRKTKLILRLKKSLLSLVLSQLKIDRKAENCIGLNLTMIIMTSRFKVWIFFLAFNFQLKPKTQAHYQFLANINLREILQTVYIHFRNINFKCWGWCGIVQD